MRGKKGLPRWIAGAHRTFKQRKRTEFRAVERAAKALFQGSAYSPAAREITLLRELMATVRQKQSVKEWGR